jgi:hypothetical protein
VYLFGFEAWNLGCVIRSGRFLSDRDLSAVKIEDLVQVKGRENGPLYLLAPPAD